MLKQINKGAPLSAVCGEVQLWTGTGRMRHDRTSPNEDLPPCVRIATSAWRPCGPQRLRASGELVERHSSGMSPPMVSPSIKAPMLRGLCVGFGIIASSWESASPGLKRAGAQRKQSAAT